MNIESVPQPTAIRCIFHHTDTKTPHTESSRETSLNFLLLSVLNCYRISLRYCVESGSLKKADSGFHLALIYTNLTHKTKNYFI